MTSETLHEIGAGFEWKPAYAEQLAHIADTDEFIHDDESHPASSDWPTLKEAIKFRIREHLLETFASERPLNLHPAAALLKSGSDATSQTAVGVAAAASSADEPVDEAVGDAQGAKDEAQERASSEEEAEARVGPADMQNFYPSSRAPASTVSPLSADEVTKQLRLLYGMLDDFDTQPPFTIQRLCELVVSPTGHYNSGAKWVAALKRCLAVTATRDAFPISPIQNATSVPNGHADEAKSDVSELEMDRMDGLAPSTGTRSRSASVASVADPLFSPIPFITEAAEADEAVPELELGGADRTHADAVPSEVVDTAPPTAAAAPEEADVVMPDTTEEAGSTAQAVDALTQADVEPAPATAPLGVPPGEVDEVDNAAATIHPLSSTTAAPPAEQSTEQDDEEEARSTKRRKSVASESDPRD
jgi:hypothetical protein